MDDKTRMKADEIMNAIDEIDGVEVTGFDLKEYIRGDPTDAESEASGAEIEITSFLSFGEIDDEDDNPYRVK